MNHSIYSADRSTHLKIVVVALVAGIAVAGFGISTAEQARVIGAHADGVVVGSAIVRTAHTDGPAAARQLCAEIKRGLKR